MQYRTMGRNGPRVSVLGFGCGAIGGLLTKGDQSEQRRTVARALEAGITYFDTAAAYGNGRSEETIGPLLRELKADVVLGTKFSISQEQIPNASAWIREQIEISLKRLGQDSVDLFNLHNRIVYDASTHPRGLSIEQVIGPVAEGLQKIRDAGLVRMIGITGLGETEAVRKVIASGLFDSVQTYINAVNPSIGWPVEGESRGQNFGCLLDTMAQHGVGSVGIRVLAAGALTLTPFSGRHENAGDPRGDAIIQNATFESDLARAQRLQALAAELGMEGPAELSYRLVISHPALSTALVGASDLSQFEDVLRWVERGPLDEATVKRVVEASA